ncbi:MAG: carbohydrate ABC transporter permease [Clostridia bacterium]|nr:carbohydrate ABC transporter permease [Clostridia bacterium]
MNYKRSAGEWVFEVINYAIMILLVIITLYPCYYVVVASVSDPTRIYEGSGILLYPKGFSVAAYKNVLAYKPLWMGYLNTIFYVGVGGFLSVIVTIMAAFGLTRRDLPFRNFLSMAIVFTMYFSGGLIPTYLVVKGLGLLNTRWSLILPTMVTTYNLIITMSYFRGLPYELEEAAKIDGASDYRILLQVMIPLAKPIIAVIALYYMVAIWNSYFNAMIYLTNRDLYPLQLVLREILIQGDTASVGGAAAQAGDVQSYAENLKFAVIVVSTIPILCVYPFIQRYFVKGVTIGAVKG